MGIWAQVESIEPLSMMATTWSFWMSDSTAAVAVAEFSASSLLMYLTGCPLIPPWALVYFSQAAIRFGKS